jgi:DNA-directed RNA polymerase subunit alpha
VIPKVECVESSETYGRFTAEPLEKGFGVTLGNALRRVLLSSLPGAAVTRVKIEGVQHEFSTLPHMKEDITDFLLNVKALRLRSYTGRPGKLILEVEGMGEVYAADIKPSADFDIVNPELHLATLNSPEARLYVEFNVEPGKGFSPASSRNSKGASIGEIPVDAIFTPVRKVNYSVELTGIGPQADSERQERLILEIWTDGTISPARALSQSAQILMEQFSVFAEVAQPAPKQAEIQAHPISSEQYNMPIEQLGLSPRTLHSLRRNRISKMGELLEMSEKDLLSLKKFGQKSLEEVQQRLKELGLALTPDSDRKPLEEE